MGNYLEDSNNKMLLFDKDDAKKDSLPSAGTHSSAERTKTPMLQKFKGVMSLSKKFSGSFKMRASINEPEPTHFNTGKMSVDEAGKYKF